MNYTAQKISPSEVEAKTVLEFDVFKPFLNRAATALSQEIKIPGFRPGKASYDIVKNARGEQAIYERAADLAIRNFYSELVQKLRAEEHIPQNQPIIGRPNITITNLEPEKNLEWTVKLTFLPVVTLPDYKEITRTVRTAESKTPSIEESEIDKTIEWIRESRMQLITVARPAEEGDAVEIDFIIRHGGVKIEGGESKNHPVVIGKGKFLKGLEDALIGMKEQEEKEFSLVVPDDWHRENLAGKKLDFRVKMKLVQDRRLPEVSDEFAKSLGEFASIEALRQNVREGLLEEKKSKERQRVRSLIIQKIAQDAETHIPEILREAELETLFRETQANIGQLGMQWPDYLQHVKKDEASLRNDWIPEAETRVKTALVLREIARTENLKASEEEIAERLAQHLAQYPTVRDAEGSEDPDGVRERIAGILTNEKVFEFLEAV